MCEGHACQGKLIIEHPLVSISLLSQSLPPMDRGVGSWVDAAAATGDDDGRGRRRRGV